MNEYYFNVSLNGRFVFRTDWEDDLVRVEQTATALKQGFPREAGYVVRKNWRAKVRYQEEI